MTKMSTRQLVVFALGVSLAVFFAGVAAVLAAGHTAPTEMWAAGGAVSGALVGLLVPSPQSKRTREALLDHARAVAGPPQMAGEGKSGLPPAAEAQEPPVALGTPAWAAVSLLYFFVGLLALSIVIAAGVIHPHEGFVQSLQSLVTPIVALASASGSALIGLMAPKPA